MVFHTRKTHPLHPSGPVRVVYAETGARTSGRSGGGGVSYLRPVLVDTGGRGPTPIRDHVMQARLLALAMIVLALMWRWAR